MEIKIDTRNDLFKRNEVSAEVESEKNLSFDEARKMIAEQTGKAKEGIDVYNIKGNFGSHKFVISANVYDSKEDKDKAEQKTQKQKKADKEEAKKSAEDAKKVAEEVKEKSVEALSEDKSEEEAKVIKEEKQGEEEAKE